MTLPPITFADPQLATRDLLRTILATSEDASAAGVTVSTRKLPGSDDGRTLPYIQVRSDGRFRNAQLDGRAVVRVVVWHSDEGLAEDLAGIAEGRLLAASNTDIRGFTSVAGPLPAGDPDNGLPMSFFTVTARLRPRQLT